MTRDDESRPVWRRLLTGQLPLETETTVFILVNVLDFFVTYWLLMNRHEMDVQYFVESNPIARYFLDRWGVVKGLLGFKLAIVLFVCLIAQVVATRKPETARKLLIVGTVLVFGVVIYGVSLYVRHGPPLR